MGCSYIFLSVEYTSVCLLLSLDCASSSKCTSWARSCWFMPS